MVCGASSLCRVSVFRPVGCLGDANTGCRTWLPLSRRVPFAGHAYSLNFFTPFASSLLLLSDYRPHSFIHLSVLVLGDYRPYSFIPQNARRPCRLSVHEVFFNVV
jgi:hypothetical protein